MANVMEEAVAALDAVTRSKRVVQIGTQRRSWPHYRLAMKKMQQGVLGDIAKVEINANQYSPYRWARNAGRPCAGGRHSPGRDWQRSLRPDDQAGTGAHLRGRGLAVLDARHQTTEPVDYPDIAAAVAVSVARGEI